MWDLIETFPKPQNKLVLYNYNTVEPRLLQIFHGLTFCNYRGLPLLLQI